MPSMANITVKASNGTTDVVYVAAVPSAGDRSPAKWTVEAANVRPAYRPTLTLVSRDNGPKTARVMEIELSHPIIEAVNGIDTVTGTVPIRVSLILPTKLSSVAVKEPVYQIGNILASAVMRGALEVGYAHT